LWLTFDCGDFAQIQSESGPLPQRLGADPVGLTPVIAAQAEFTRLGMTATAHRNGVLIFLAPRSRNFAVIGDTAVHEKCGDAFWADLAAAMTAHFQRSDFTAGLVHGIEHAGKLLAEHFPRSAADRNELPSDITEID
jgi:uncharacterized membrane protein